MKETPRRAGPPPAQAMPAVPAEARDADNGRGALPAVLRPFVEFVQLEAAGAILLLACAVIALLWANSPWAGGYVRLWRTPVTIGVGRGALTETLGDWVNDGLMVLFFFIVGLEIKRELLMGELASVRHAALPFAAALGGMIAPALIYTALNHGHPEARGWGVPMATDIAFALGVLALVGDRVPLGLKVFLAAFAIADDLGAVVVIAVFYTAHLALGYLLLAAALFVIAAVVGRAGVRWPPVYLVLGVLLWYAVLRSGVHATIAGVLLAMTIPVGSRIDTDRFVWVGRALLDRFAAAGHASKAEPINDEHQAALHALERAADAVQMPIERMQNVLHPWVTFGIMPLFALANAGVPLVGQLPAAAHSPVSLGVALGLIFGKPVGILLFVWLAVRMGIATLPRGVGWRQTFGAAVLGGIGFTMSLFIAGLAFRSAAELDQAKIGIFAGSLVSGAVGWFLVRRATAQTEGGNGSARSV